MTEVNILIHLFTFFVFVFLSYALVRMQKQRDFIRILAAESRGNSKRLHFGSARKYLALFTNALGIHFVDLCSTSFKNQKIEFKGLYDLFTVYGIKEIKLYAKKDKILCEIALLNKFAESNLKLEELLSRELGLSVHIR